MVYTKVQHKLTQKHTGQQSKILLSITALTSLIERTQGQEMVSRFDKKKDQDSEESRMSERDVRLLLVICTELVNFCAKMTGQIDPAAAAMLAYVRDDIRFENKLRLP